MTDETTQMTARPKATAFQADTPASGNGVAPSKPKAAVVPIKAPKGIPDIAFPGGTVSPVCDGRVKVTLDPGSGARTLGGSNYQAFAETLLGSVLATIHTSTNDPQAGTNRIAAAAPALAAFKPTDEVEAMLAGQAVAMHHMAMECFRRATLGDQHPDIASKLRKDGANLCRGMVDMLDGLDRRRGKVSQTVRVERVVVHEGGQAIVGNVQGGATPPTAPSLAIAQEQSAISMDDLIKQRELVAREGVV
jgi:hypothetical protein